MLPPCVRTDRAGLPLPLLPPSLLPHERHPSDCLPAALIPQIDMSYYVIAGLEKLGLAWDVKRPTPAQLASKRLNPAA